MFRHLLNHEMLHAYRIEELLLKKDWDQIKLDIAEIETARRV